MLSRLIYGARVSLAVGVAAVTIGGLIGITLGVIGGYFGGRLDDVIMRLADVQLAFPFILLAILVLVILGSGVINLVIILAVGQWVVYARIARGETIAQKRKDYVDSARSVGVSNLRIIWRGILPNILAPLIVIASFNVAAVILSEAALSFLGLGVPPEVPTWGGMLAESRDQLLGGYWWLALFPGLAIMFTVLSLNILGDWLRDFLDPRLPWPRSPCEAARRNARPRAQLLFTRRRKDAKESIKRFAAFLGAFADHQGDPNDRIQRRLQDRTDSPAICAR